MKSYEIIYILILFYEVFKPMQIDIKMQFFDIGIISMAFLL